MKTKTIFGFFVIVLAGIIVLTACGSPANEGPSQTPPNTTGETEGYTEMNIILSHASPIDDARHIGALAFKELIETESGGKITVDVYPSGQLGDARSTVEAVQNGAIHICLQPPANVIGFNPLMAVLDIPYFLPGNMEDARKVIDGKAGDALLATMDNYGMKGLDFWDSQFKVFSANKPLRSTSDFKGLKFRVMASDILIKMIEALGGSALTFDYSEVFSALQTGSIDGQEASAASIYNMKFHEVQDYVSITNHIKSEILVFANKAWYDGLNDDTKSLIEKGLVAGCEANNKAKAELENEAIELIKQSGTQVVELTDEEIKSLSDAAREPCLQLFLERNGEEGRSIVDIFNESIAELDQ